MNKEYREKAIKWFERGKKENDIFIKFIIYYISFEILTKLRNLDKCTLNEDIKEEFFNIANSKILEELKNILDERPLINMQDNSKLVRLNDIHDFPNILMFVNYGRNNLFHGDKSLDIERDKIIVNFGSQILEKLVNSIIAI